MPARSAAKSSTPCAAPPRKAWPEEPSLIFCLPWSVLRRPLFAVRLATERAGIIGPDLPAPVGTEIARRADELARFLDHLAQPCLQRLRRQRQHQNLVHAGGQRSEEHTSELQSLMRISYAVFCLKTKNNIEKQHHKHT